MFKSWNLALIFILFLTASLFSATKIKINKKQVHKIKEYVYIENGMQHHLVRNKTVDTFGKTSVTTTDTIQHANVSFPAGDGETTGPWDEGIQEYLSAGDKVANWYTLAADTARILEIHASFATKGTASWNVWPRGDGGPDTDNGFLVLDIPKEVSTINSDDGTINGIPTGEWQVFDLVDAGVDAEITGNGVYVGYFTDGTNGPKMYMDNGGHDYDDPDWLPATAYLRTEVIGSGNSTGWYIWWVSSAREYTEFVQRIVVSYEYTAPIVTNITNFPDIFAGNPAYNTVTADVVDIDGSVASVSLVWAIGRRGSLNSANMTLDGGDTYSGSFTSTFNGGDTVFYWIEATDNEGHTNATQPRVFNIAPTPAFGMDYLLVSDNPFLDPDNENSSSRMDRLKRFEEALDSLGQQYYTWDIKERGGISSYEINYQKWTIIWTGFGSTNLPSPFEKGPHPIKDLLDAGGNLLIVDNDYLFTHDYSNEVLTAGDFAYDYLGMQQGISDPDYGDREFSGHTGDPIGGNFSGGINIYPESISFNAWFTGDQYASDWQDLLKPNDVAFPTFYNSYYDTDNFNSAIRYSNGTFATAFFAFSIETASDVDFEGVLQATLDWLQQQNPTAIENPDNNVPLTFVLEQNYPNPFNPNTTINFSIPGVSNVKIEVFNNLGQRIKTLVNKSYTSGSYSTSWKGLDNNNNNVASGIYYYKMSTGDHFEFKKMLLIK